MRAACGLSPRSQRLLFGKPPTLEGQTIASDVQVLLRLAVLSGIRSLTAGDDLEEIRAKRRVEAEVTAGPPLPMARIRELELPGPAGKLAARLYEPRGAGQGAQALLVFYHGGGWVIGDLDTHDGVCRFLAANSGALVLSVDYRLAPEHRFPAAVEDAHAAYIWAREQAAELGADHNRIAVGGDSAGANLATVVCHLVRDGGEPPAAMQLLIYPATDAYSRRPSRQLFGQDFLLTLVDIDWFEDKYLPDRATAADPRASVIRAENFAELPPAYVVTAGFDPLRDEGEAYAERMREAGVHVALRRQSGLVHSFANLTAVSRSAAAAMREVAGALRMGLA